MRYVCAAFQWRICLAPAALVQVLSRFNRLEVDFVTKTAGIGLPCFIRISQCVVSVRVECMCTCVSVCLSVYMHVHTWPAFIT